MKTPTCTELSTHHNEPIHGTALARTWRWIALEVRDPWTAKGFPDCDLPEALHAKLSHLNDNVEGTRVQFIRRPQTDPNLPFSLFLGRSDGAKPVLYRYTAASLADFAPLDMESVLLGMDDPAARHDGPLHLVCAHGKRDPCCARWGVGLFKGLSARSPETVWQTSHLGGHRFAATMVALPSGVQYGRLRAKDADPLMDTLEAGTLYRMDTYRGRTCFSAAEQAAEAVVRESSGVMDLDSASVVHVETASEGLEHTVAFDVNGARHEAKVRRRMTVEKWRMSCNKAKTSPAVIFEPV